MQPSGRRRRRRLRRSSLVRGSAPRSWVPGSSATRMARRPEWKGAWVPTRLHTPVFVLTHHPRASIEMEGGTTFHFIDVSPGEHSRRAARLRATETYVSRRPHRYPRLLAAGLIDHLHVVVVRSCSAEAYALGRTGRHREGLTRSRPRPRRSGVTHVTLDPCRCLHPAFVAPGVDGEETKVAQPSSGRARWRSPSGRGYSRAEHARSSYWTTSLLTSCAPRCGVGRASRRCRPRRT